MDRFIDKQKEGIGDRIRQFRRILSLSRKQLAKVTGISGGTIKSIESGKGFTGDYILAIGRFFGMELCELADTHLPLPDEIGFRSRIKKFHKKIKSTAYKVLDEPPNLNAIIEFRLAKTDFLLKKMRSVKEIKEFCKNEYGLHYNSSVLSQSLKNAVEDEILVRKLKDKRNYLYQAVEKDK